MVINGHDRSAHEAALNLYLYKTKLNGEENVISYPLGPPFQVWNHNDTNVKNAVFSGYQVKRTGLIAEKWKKKKKKPAAHDSYLMQWKIKPSLVHERRRICFRRKKRGSEVRNAASRQCWHQEKSPWPKKETRPRDIHLLLTEKKRKSTKKPTANSYHHYWRSSESQFCKKVWVNKGTVDRRFRQPTNKHTFSLRRYWFYQPKNPLLRIFSSKTWEKKRQKGMKGQSKHTRRTVHHSTELCRPSVRSTQVSTFQDRKKVISPSFRGTMHADNKTCKKIGENHGRDSKVPKKSWITQTMYLDTRNVSYTTSSVYMAWLQLCRPSVRHTHVSSNQQFDCWLSLTYTAAY